MIRPEVKLLPLYDTCDINCTNRRAVIKLAIFTCSISTYEQIIYCSVCARARVCVCPYVGPGIWYTVDRTHLNMRDRYIGASPTARFIRSTLRSTCINDTSNFGNRCGVDSGREQRSAPSVKSSHARYTAGCDQKLM